MLSQLNFRTYYRSNRSEKMWIDWIFSNGLCTCMLNISKTIQIKHIHIILNLKIASRYIVIVYTYKLFWKENNKIEIFILRIYRVEIRCRDLLVYSSESDQGRGSSVNQVVIRRSKMSVNISAPKHSSMFVYGLIWLKSDMNVVILLSTGIWWMHNSQWCEQTQMLWAC